MGIVARLRDEGDAADILRLGSRVRIPAEIRRARNEELAREIARVQVQTARMEGVGWGGMVGARVITNVSQCIELAAGQIPEERHRVDSVADTVAITINRLVAELGQ